MSAPFLPVIALLTALLAPCTQSARAADIESVDPGTVAGIRALESDSARLQTLGWKLARANAPFCAQTRTAGGFLLLDMALFGNPDPIRRAMGFSGDVGIEAVAAGSPAALAGLRAGDEVLAIEGRAMAAFRFDRRNAFARLTALDDAIDAAMRARAAVDLQVVTPGLAPRQVQIAGASTCRSRFELILKGTDARAGVLNVRISRQLLAENADDGQAAALIAHELAHVVLAHRSRLRRTGHGFAAIRATEREADRLAVWLIANAGYDPQAAVRFMAAWGPRHDPPILGFPDHDGWRARVVLMQAELAGLRASLAGGARLPIDWRDHFAAGPDAPD